MPVPAFCLTMLHTQEAESSLYAIVSKSLLGLGLLAGGNSRVAIRYTGQAARLGDARCRAPREYIVPADGEPVLVAVEVRHDGELGVGEVALLDQHLGAHARVDA